MQTMTPDPDRLQLLRGRLAARARAAELDELLEALNDLVPRDERRH